MALSGFTSLGEGLWLSDVSSTLSTSGNHSVGLVIICAWMGAAPRHIAKYTAQHRLLFPKAQLLVLQSEPLDVAWRSDNYQVKRFAPARAVVQSFLGRKDQQDQHILLHSFSNGGAQTACQLVSQTRQENGKRLPVKAMVLDSSPGGATVERGVTAFAASLPRSGPIRWLGVGMLYVALSSLLIYLRIMQRENVVDQIRRQLNDPSIFNPDAPRTYMYSKTDKLVDWHDVEQHAADAKAAGFDVRTEPFDGSEHVAHAMVDQNRYWSVIEALCLP